MSLETYREILNQEFVRRHQANPRFSLGAFSQRIGLSPSQLHDILKGRYGMSRQKAEAVAERLQLGAQKAALFCALVESEHGRSQKVRDQAKKLLVKLREELRFKELANDQFALISEWYHNAILELTQLETFESNLEWVARRLGLSEATVREAVARLRRLGLLIVEDGKWRSTDDYSLVGGQVPSRAIKRYHKDILDKAKLAIDEQALKAREFNAATFSLSKEQIPEAKAMLNEFLKDFGMRFTQVGNKDAVYCLSMQLFALSKEVDK